MFGWEPGIGDPTLYGWLTVAAYAFAGLIAAVGGVLFTWYNGLITPGSVGTSWLINIAGGG